MGLCVKPHGATSWSLWLGLLLSLLMAACSRDDNERTVEILRVAVLPDQGVALLRSKYGSLCERIKSHTGLDYTLQFPESYAQLLQWFEDKQVDIARFGGATYVMAHLQSKAEPLVMRDVDGRFRTVGLVHANNPADSLRDLKGASIAFGDVLSTAGHFMPRYFFQKKNIIPEKYFRKISYSGAHDRTAEWVRDGKVELGVANSGIINEMLLDGRLGREEVKVIWESPPYSDYVWAVQPYVSHRQKTVIRDAFMSMSQDDEGKRLLVQLGANYYIPASHDDFNNLEKTILQMQRREVAQ